MRKGPLRKFTALRFSVAVVAETFVEMDIDAPVPCAFLLDFVKSLIQNYSFDFMFLRDVV